MKRIVPALFACLTALVGCSDAKNNKAYFEINPSSPLVYQQVRIQNIRYVYEIILDANNPGSPRIGLEADGTAQGYFNTPGLKRMRGEDPRNDVEPFEITFGVRHTKDLEQIADSFPANTKPISNADWTDHFLPSLKPETRTEIDNFETYADLRGTFDVQPASVVRAIGPEGYWLFLENTTLSGTTDTNGDGNPDYAGLPALVNPNVPVDMQQDIVDHGFTPQTKDLTLAALLSIKPSTLRAEPGDPNYDATMILSSPALGVIGIIQPDLIFDYIINGRQITVGIYVGEPKIEDQTTIAAFNDSLGGVYSPQSILKLPPEKTVWEYRKAWTLEHQRHITNNP